MVGLRVHMYFSNVYQNFESSFYKTCQFSASCLYQGSCQVTSLSESVLKTAAKTLYSPNIQEKKIDAEPMDPKNPKKKKKDSKLVSYILIGTAAATTTLLVLNLWNRGTLSHGFCKTSLNDLVPVLDIHGDITLDNPKFTPKTFVPIVALVESLYFLKKATLGVSSKDLINLAKKSPIVAFKYIEKFSSDVQDSIRKAVASSVVCMKNSGSIDDETQYRTSLSTAHKIYPEYDEDELASDISKCKKNLAWDRSSAKAYLQALEDVQRVEKFLGQADPVLARQSASEILQRPLAFSLKGISNVQEKADLEVDRWYARNIETVLSSYEANSPGREVLKYGEFSHSKATELMRIVATVDGRSPRIRLQNLERIFRLIYRDLKPTQEDLMSWNALIVPEPHSKTEFDDYVALLPKLLQKMTVDQRVIGMFLESWKGKFTYNELGKLSMVVLDFCLQNQKAPGKYIFFSDAVQQIISSYSRMSSDGFLDTAATAFVSSYMKKGSYERGFNLDATTIEKIRGKKNAQLAETWLLALQKAFERKKLNWESDFLKRAIEENLRKQKGKYTYDCGNGYKIECTDTKETCDKIWRASCPKVQSGFNKGFQGFGFDDDFFRFNSGGGFHNFGQQNTRSQQDSELNSKLKGISSALSAYANDLESAPLKEKAGELFEYYTKIGKNVADVKEKDVETDLWPSVKDVLTKAVLKKAYRAWSLLHHPDAYSKKNQIAPQGVFEAGSAVYDCLEKKLKGEGC